MVKRIWLFLLLTLLTANAFAQSATTATIRGKITTARVILSSSPASPLLLCNNQ